MKNKTILILVLAFSTLLWAQEEKEVKIPEHVLKKMEQLQKGELNQLEKVKLADELHHAGAKAEALALYEENLPIDKIQRDIPAAAYLNYGTALLEKGDAQKGLDVYERLSSTLDSNNSESKKIKEMLEKNVVNFFQVQEQKKEQEKKDKKDNKDKQENKDNKDQQDKQQGSSGEGQDKKDQKDQQGQNPKDQKNKQDQGGQSQDKQDKKDGQEKKDEKEDQKKEDGEKESDKDKDQDKDQENDSEKKGEEKKLPTPKMSPKLKQLMSDDRQLQLKVIEQGTRDMNRRQNRDNKDW